MSISHQVLKHITLSIACKCKGILELEFTFFELDLGPLYVLLCFSSICEVGTIIPLVYQRKLGNIYMPKITQLGGSKLYLIIFSVVNQLQTGSFKNLFLLFWANFQVLNSSLTQMWVAAGFLWCYILVFWNFSFHFSFILYDFWSKNQVATWISSTHSYAVLKGIIAQWLRAWMLGPKLPVFQSWLCLLLAVWIDLSVP